MSISPHVYSVLNLVVYIALIVVNVIAGVYGIDGQTNASRSAQYPTYITPAGWAFSIWGIIFLLQGIFVVYALIPVNSEEKTPFMHRLSFFPALGWAMEIAWQFAFSYDQIPLSAVLITLAALFMIIAFFRVNIMEYTLLEQLSKSSGKAVLGYVAFNLPFAMNAGWLTAATLVNYAILFDYAKDTSYALSANLCALPIVAAVLLGVLFTLLARDVVYALTLVWALTAIATNNHTASTVFDLAIIGISILGVTAMAQAVRSLRKTSSSPYSQL